MHATHEAADIFPLEEETIPKLAEDIRKNGLLVPIERLDGKIIDGRRRLRACELAKVKPEFHDLTITITDPIAYVLSLNLHRRHLSPSQLSMVAARAREWYDKRAKERMRAGQKAGGRGHKKNSGANLPESLDGRRSRDEAADAVGVGGRTVDYATKVLKHGVPELVKAVDEDKVAVSRAAEIAKENPDTQREEIVRAQAPEKEPRPAEPKADPQPETNHKSRGKGITLAHEAINLLSRIPKNDALRKRGFQIVLEWVQRNLRKM